VACAEAAHAGRGERAKSTSPRPFEPWCRRRGEPGTSPPRRRFR